MAKVIAVVNQKGGDGKSTIAAHLVFAAAEAGKSVLLVDLDGQGNSSMYVTGDMAIGRRKRGSEMLFADKELPFTPGLNKYITVLHGHKYLDSLDRRDEILTMSKTPEMKARVRNLPFDLIVFDTPPNPGPRQAAPLFWANLALIVVKPSPMSLPGFRETLEAIHSIMRVNPGMRRRIVLNLIKKSSGSHTRIRNEIATNFRPEIVAELTDRSAVQDAVEEFEPVWNRARDKRIGNSWRTFASDVLALVA